MMNITTEKRVPTNEHPPREHRWMADAFYRAADAGAFADPARLELIHGRIIEKMPISPLHTALTNTVADALRAALSPRLLVRTESAIHIAFDGEPIPDVAVVVGSNRDDMTGHPAPEDVRLLVAVALPSASIDTGDKALLYAQAGISDYWLALPETGQIVVHRRPTADGYAEVTRVEIDGMVSPLVEPDALLSVRELLGRPVGDAPFGVNQA